MCIWWQHLSILKPLESLVLTPGSWSYYKVPYRHDYGGSLPRTKKTQCNLFLWFTFHTKDITDNASAAVQRGTQEMRNWEQRLTIAWLGDCGGGEGEGEGAYGEWRMQGLHGPFTRQACGERSLVFHRALMCRAGLWAAAESQSWGLLCKLGYAPLRCQEPGMQSGADIIFSLIPFIIYLHTLCGVKVGQQVSLEG